MTIAFQAMRSGDSDSVIDFLSSNHFPFHVQNAPSAESVRMGVENGCFWSEDAQGYWIEDTGDRLGMVVVEDLRDDAPLFDLRLSDAHRGKGNGVKVLRVLSDLVFTSMPEVLRFEGQTREDNLAMRKTFIRSSFLKEAHYRLGWPTQDGALVASVAYAILRQDWESNTITHFEWDDIEAQVSKP